MRVRGIRRLLAVSASAVLLLTVVGAAPVAACDQGCTPGYWKNHTDTWLTYGPNQTVGSVFVIPAELSSLANVTLIDALQGKGGPGLVGAAKILLRAGVASLLNAAVLGDNFAYPDWVIAQVNRALDDPDRVQMLLYAEWLDGLNNTYCPLN
ncbi:MAG: hypothetical protein AB1627_11815 [Chloroflexota bacterium]